MATAKGKFRVNEEKRIVRAYNEDVISNEDFETIERYKRLDYKVILIPRKPKQYNHIKNDMIKYLENKIDDEIYLKFIDKVEQKENFLKLKWWLIKELQKKENNKKIDFDYIKGIINQAKSKENKVIEKAKAQAEKENKEKLNENK